MASPIPHGTTAGYKRGCRCTDCRTAVAAYYRRRRADRRKYVEENGLPSEISHGNSAYHNWGCRCGVCTEAAVDDDRERRKARRR